MEEYIGLDIGGTKCAVLTAKVDSGKPEITFKKRINTKDYSNPYDNINYLCDCLLEHLKEINKDIKDFKCAGISCGSPLDSNTGYILSPPNLPGWDEFPVTKLVYERLGIKAYLQNDANACAIAEWQFGAGKGYNNVVFLTFGTGFGAGMILDGKLYEGTNGNAGEIGHVRLAKNGPVGYNKAGSVEGFCSGGGLRLQGLKEVEKCRKRNIETMLDENVDAKSIFECARKGDKTALKIVERCGKKLGESLAILIDILNPEAIIIGSIYERNEDLLYKKAWKVIDKEALNHSANVCKILKAQLGDSLGDMASIAIAYERNKNEIS